MATDGCASSDFRLLQPELLSRSDLIEILISRCVSSETISAMTKENLIDLYRRVVLPLPQREYNNRTKRNNKGIKLRQAISPPDNKKGGGYTIGFNGTLKTDAIGTLTSVNSLNKNIINNNRLKPPPEYESSSKKLRLSTPKSSLDNIIINDRRKSQNGEQKVLLSSPNDSICNDNGKHTSLDKEEKHNSVEPKRVALKRNFSTHQVISNNSSSPPISTIEVIQEKKQKTKITWP